MQATNRDSYVFNALCPQDNNGCSGRKNEGNSDPGRCRTCANHDDNMVSIYSPEGQARQLDEKINTYLPITVSEEDNLPLTMCFTCIERLEAGHKIFESCLTAEELLRKCTGDSYEEQKQMHYNNVDVEMRDSGSESENDSVHIAASPLQTNMSPTESSLSNKISARKTILGGSNQAIDAANSTKSLKLRISAIKTENQVLPGPSQANKELTKTTQKRRQTKKEPTARKIKVKTVPAARKPRATRSAPSKPKVGKRGSNPPSKKATSSEASSDESEDASDSSGNKLYVKTFACRKCGEKFDKKHLHKIHMRQHRIANEVLTHSCKACGQKFRTSYLLSEHRKSHSTLKDSYPCSVCGKEFKTITHLKQHEVIHSSEKPFQCNLCHKSFKRKYELTHHIKYHSVTDYECPKCQKMFKSKHYLKLHLERHVQLQKKNKDVDPDKPVNCPVCDALFKRQRSMEYHMYFKHPDSPFIAQIDIKIKEKTFSCSYCSAKFSSKPTLKLHINKHTKQKTYVCKFCQKVFYYPSVLQQHIRSLHSEDRPFPCSYCEKRFRRRDGLELHTRTHTGEKPHICDICGRGFAQSGDMKKHRERHGRETQRKQAMPEKFSHPTGLYDHACALEQEQDAAELLRAMVFSRI